MTPYRRRLVCKALNISVFDVAAMCAIDEGEYVETPDDDWFREHRKVRRTRALAEMLLPQVYFKEEKDKAEFRDYVLQLIEGEKFDMRRLTPKT